MRIVLHAGPPKTGTSSIQAFLHINREALSRHRVYVPASRNQATWELVFLSKRNIDEPTRASAKWGIVTDADLEAARPEFEATVTNWLEEAQSYSVCIFSCEGLIMNTEEEVSDLKNFLSGYAERIDVLIFLRRPDLAINSGLKNQINNHGHDLSAAFDNYSDLFDEFNFNYLDYDKILKTWEKSMGKDHVHPVVFPDSSAQDVDLLEVFLGAAGIPFDHDEFEDPGRRNEAWDRRAIEILSQVNAYIPALQDGEIPKSRRLIEQALMSAFPDGEPLRIPKQLAMDICARHEEANREVARRWFDRERLFHDDFSMYDTDSGGVLEPADFISAIVETARIAAAKTGKAGKTAADLKTAETSNPVPAEQTDQSEQADDAGEAIGQDEMVSTEKPDGKRAAGAGKRAEKRRKQRGGGRKRLKRRRQQAD